MIAEEGKAYRHKKTGGVYVVRGICKREADEVHCVLYAAFNERVSIPWCRPIEEFCDGRFEPITETIV